MPVVITHPIITTMAAPVAYSFNKQAILSPKVDLVVNSKSSMMVDVCASSVAINNSFDIQIDHKKTITDKSNQSTKTDSNQGKLVIIPEDNAYASVPVVNAKLPINSRAVADFSTKIPNKHKFSTFF